VINIETLSEFKRKWAEYDENVILIVHNTILGNWVNRSIVFKRVLEVFSSSTRL
jgi:hypothetical protein